MDLLTLLVALVGLAWTSALVLRGSLVAGCLVFAIGGSLFGYAFWHFDAAPLTIDRLLAVLLVAMYLVHRWMGWTDCKPMSKADWVLVAFLTTLVFCTFSHDWKYDGYRPVFQLVQYFLIPAACYWIVRQSPLDQRQVRWIYVTLAGFGVFVSLTAIAEMLGWHAVLLPRHLASPELEYFGRARGPLLNPAGNGVLITLCLVAGLTLWQRVGRIGQLGVLAFTALSSAALYATLTRSAWIGGALGLAIYLSLSTHRSWRNLLIGCGVAAGLVLTVANWDRIWNLKRDVELQASASAESAELRPLLAKVAWNMFLDRPLLGAGFGQYEQEKMPYLADRTEQMPLGKTKPYIQHNAFLALLTETGLVGASLFIMLLGYWSATAFRLARDRASPLWMQQVGIVFLSLLGAYLVNANFHDTNMIDMLNAWLFLLGGLVVGVDLTRRRTIVAPAESIRIPCAAGEPPTGRSSTAPIAAAGHECV